MKRRIPQPSLNFDEDPVTPAIGGSQTEQARCEPTVAGSAHTATLHRDRGAKAVGEVAPAYDSPVGMGRDSDSLPYHPSTWNEVPQALFLSWSPAMQAAYCARRDRDAAESAETTWWRDFYLQRAEMYEQFSR